MPNHVTRQPYSTGELARHLALNPATLRAWGRAGARRAGHCTSAPTGPPCPRGRAARAGRRPHLKTARARTAVTAAWRTAASPPDEAAALTV